MDLAELYRLEGMEGLRRLAHRCGTVEKYVYQCATRRKVPSPEMAKTMIAADPRLTLHDIYQCVQPRTDGDGEREAAA